MAFAAAIGCAGEAGSLVVEPIDAPAPPGSLVPQLTALTGEDLALSWLEPREDEGYRFRMAIREDGVWRETVTIDESPHIAMFGADLPGVAELAGGDLFAYWEYADHASGNVGGGAGREAAHHVHRRRRIVLSLSLAHGGGKRGHRQRQL